MSGRFILAVCICLSCASCGTQGTEHISEDITEYTASEYSETVTTTEMTTAETTTADTTAAETTTAETTNADTTVCTAETEIITAITQAAAEFALSGDVTDYVVNIGIPLEERYSKGNIARFIPDIIAYDGRIYVGGGDDEDNQGAVPLMAYDEEGREWTCEYKEVPEEKIQRFYIINDTLMFSGADPMEDWTFGNYYFLNDGEWVKRRNIPESAHDYGIYWYDNSLFIGIGSVPKIDESVYPAVKSVDNGETFEHIPFLKDGEPLNIVNMPLARVYNFFEFDNEFYCTLWVRSDDKTVDYFELYRYNDNVFVYAESLDYFTAERKYNPRSFVSVYEINGRLLMVNENGLHVTYDLKSYEPLDVCGTNSVSDLNVHNGTVYVLANTADGDGYINSVCESIDGEVFTEKFSFRTDIPAYCFTIGTEGYYFALGDRFCSKSDLFGTVLFIPFAEGAAKTSAPTTTSPEDVIAQLYEKDGAETVEYYKSKIAGSFEFDGNLCVIVDDNMMVSIVNSGTMEIVDISKNAEYADIKIVEGNGTYYLVTKCVKGFDTAFRTWGVVTDISTAEEVAWYEHEYDGASCTDSTPVEELPASEEYDSYADLAVVEDASQILKDFFTQT